MAAPKRNKNAQKWSAQRVWYYLRKIEQAGRKQKSLFWGRVLVKLGLYRDIWRYWRQRYGHIETIRAKMALIETLFESNLHEAACKGLISVRRVMRCMHNIHGWGRKSWMEREEQLYAEEQVNIPHLQNHRDEMARAA